MIYFDFEKYAPMEEMAIYISRYYPTLFIICAIYYLAIKYGQDYMSERKPLQVKNALIYWNFGLATYSILTAIRLIEETYLFTTKYSIAKFICDDKIQTPVARFWLVLFVISKLVEFGDTFFLVARKKPVIFLHWYHHITVTLLSFYLWSLCHATSRPFALMNSIVHSFMYTYFALAAIGVKIPRNIAFCITIMQLSQMFFGLGISITYLCNCTYGRSGAYFALAIYSSYAYLFGEFLVQSYFCKKPKSLPDVVTQTQTTITTSKTTDFNNNYVTKEIKCN